MADVGAYREDDGVSIERFRDCRTSDAPRSANTRVLRDRSVYPERNRRELGADARGEVRDERCVVPLSPLPRFRSLHLALGRVEHARAFRSEESVALDQDSRALEVTAAVWTQYDRGRA